MKKIIIIILLIVATLSVPASVIAVPYSPYGSVCNTAATASSAVCSERRTGNPVTGSNGIIVKVTRIIAFAAGVAAVIIIIVAAIRMITSNGDSKSFGEARQTILTAAIGLAVIFFAQAIILFVVDRVK